MQNDVTVYHQAAVLLIFLHMFNDQPAQPSPLLDGPKAFIFDLSGPKGMDPAEAKSRMVTKMGIYKRGYVAYHGIRSVYKWYLS